MDITSDSILLKGLSNESLTEYLTLSGWSQQRNTKWIVLRGSEDAYGDPLEVVLPRDDDTRERRVYQASAINLLSGLQDEDPQITIQRIKYYDSDVFTLVNDDARSYDSIPLQRATSQVAGLKGLVGYSARSEHELRAYYDTRSNAIASNIIARYRFEHTMRGSFGFTIRTRIPNTTVKPVQMNIFSDHDADISLNVSIAPIERRVMERIVRGFATAQASVERANYKILVDEYASGFNSNMCRVAANLKQDHQGPIEFRVLWSPKIKPSDDVLNVNRMQLEDRSRRYLSIAASELKHIDPEPITIQGNVRGVLSNGNPFDDDESIERFVVVRWTNREGNQRPVNLLVAVNRAGYQIAYDSHRSQTPVQATGIVAKVGNEWRMAETMRFSTI